MPGSLIPPTKKIKKRRSNIGALALKKAKEPKRLIYLGILAVIIILIFAFYGIVKAYQKSLEKRVVELGEEIKELELEKQNLRESGELVDFQTKLSVVGGLIDNHAYWTNIFDLLEKNTLSKVRYISFSGDINRESLALEEATTRFTKLAEQMIMLKQPSWIKELKLSSLKMSEDGISFGFNIRHL